MMRRPWVKWLALWLVALGLSIGVATLLQHGPDLTPLGGWLAVILGGVLAIYIPCLVLYSMIVIWGEVGAWMIDRRRPRPRGV